MLTSHEKRIFLQIVRDYYRQHGRHDLPWRVPESDGSFDPYKILVSEIMLQQTQVARVISKYYEFLSRFPSVESLAAASLGEVLTIWSGLGYNRRAKFLWQAARIIANEYQGKVPATIAELTKLSGVGENTAGAILAYAFNQPVVFIETNIRTVYIHHFFSDQTNVPDAAIAQLVGQTLDESQPRVWYWALMDYGAHLKQTNGNLNKLSKHYAKQPPFVGSLRQIRGEVIRQLTVSPLSLSELEHKIPDDRLGIVLADLVREQLIVSTSDEYHLA